MPPNEIIYISHSLIDKAKWDHCINTATNSLIYGHSFYLDHMAGRWDALVLNDYEAVMPVTWKKKWGIPYLCQPPFTPQLGVFYAGSGKHPMVADFITIIKGRFRFAEIFFNHHNSYDQFTSRHCNLVIPLHHGFDVLQKSFKTDLRKNLSRSKKFTLDYIAASDYRKAIELFKENYGSSIPHVSREQYNRFIKLCGMAAASGQVLIREIRGLNNELLAINLFLKDDRRIYNIMSTTMPNGRTLEANHVLLYEFIREFAGQRLILDLEGSDIAGIARFYRKFGAVDEPYFFLRFNKLPGWLKYLKGG